VKILSLAGEHLASLDRFAVRFDQPPLAAAGLLVISGPTGAGKSTLLDAMCLALYDRTPRLGKNPLSLLQHSAVSAKAVVEFRDGQGQRYRATWHIHRARKRLAGDWQESQIELENADSGESLGSHRKTDTLEIIKVKIGLGFEQFCRSVLLAQGQFQRFLHETGDERAKLLETITGGEIYSQLSRQAFLQHKATAEALALLQQRLAGLSPLTDEQLRALAAEEQQLQQRHETLLAAEQAATAQLAWERERAQRLAEVEQATAALALANTAVADSAPLRQELAAAERAEQLRPAVTELRRAEAVASQRRSALALAQQSEQSATAAAAAAEQGAQQAAAAVERASQRIAAAGPLLASATNLAQKQEEVAAQAAAATGALTAIRRDVERHQRSKLKSQRERDRLAGELETLEADLGIARAAADLVGRRHELLQPNRPCPLCGSRVHPLAAVGDGEPSLLSQLLQQRQAQQAALRSASESEQQAALQEQVAAQQLATASAYLEQLQQQLAGWASELRQLLLALPAADLALRSDDEPAPDLVLRLTRELTQAQQLADRAAKQALELQLSRSSAAARAHEAVQQLQQQVEEATAATAQAQRILLGDLDRTELIDLPTAERLLLVPPSTRSGQRQQLLAIDKAVTQAESLLADRQRRYADSSAESLGERLTVRRAAIATALDLLGQPRPPAGQSGAVLPPLTAARQQTEEQRLILALELRDGQQRQAEAAALAVEAAEQRRLLTDWAALSELIGSADGKKLRLFAQGLTLDTLLAFANRQLLRLRPRYSLRRKNERMELEMVDHDMGDEVRECATLSGGETFLVSLALALGLSSLTARNLRVESLFIDEGFGTLDRDTLDSALAVLEELQATGQQIGVISHVVELADRVPFRVAVEPRRPGRSVVSVHGPVGGPALLQGSFAYPSRQSAALQSGEQASLFADGGLGD
jgi:exonuclease SbcC